MTRRFLSSRPDTWTEPRAHRDASQRLHIHGPLQPMDADPDADPDRLSIWPFVVIAALLAVAVFS